MDYFLLNDFFNLSNIDFSIIKFLQNQQLPLHIFLTPKFKAYSKFRILIFYCL